MRPICLKELKVILPEKQDAKNRVTFPDVIL